MVAGENVLVVVQETNRTRRVPGRGQNLDDKRTGADLRAVLSIRESDQIGHQVLGIERTDQFADAAQPVFDYGFVAHVAVNGGLGLQHQIAAENSVVPVAVGQQNRLDPQTVAFAVSQQAIAQKTGVDNDGFAAANQEVRGVEQSPVIVVKLDQFVADSVAFGVDHNRSDWKGHKTFFCFEGIETILKQQKTQQPRCAVRSAENKKRRTPKNVQPKID